MDVAHLQLLIADETNHTTNKSEPGSSMAHSHVQKHRYPTGLYY
jgi:hypothetical protein